jgi:RNase H-like domain found in reverse transcriptase
LVKKDVRLKWSEECATAFETLKSALISKPILQLAQMEKPFTVTTDASLENNGFILAQMNEQRFVAIAYGGFAQKSY